jgi:uncharacterized protein YecT (DUF1311 family)
MKRTITVVIASIVSFGVVSVSQEKRTAQVPCGETGTQAEANACARGDYEKADAELNKVYKQLLAELAGYQGEDGQKLRHAQSLWLQYRDANCESESSIYQGGSIRPAVYNSCLASVTRERTGRLKEFLAVTRQ